MDELGETESAVNGEDISGDWVSPYKVTMPVFRSTSVEDAEVWNLGHAMEYQHHTGKPTYWDPEHARRGAKGPHTGARCPVPSSQKGQRSSHNGGRQVAGGPRVKISSSGLFHSLSERCVRRKQTPEVMPRGSAIAQQGQ